MSDAPEPPAVEHLRQANRAAIHERDEVRAEAAALRAAVEALAQTPETDRLWEPSDSGPGCQYDRTISPMELRAALAVSLEKVVEPTIRTRRRRIGFDGEATRPTVTGDAATIGAGGKTYVIVAGDIAVVSYADLPRSAQSCG